MAKDTTGQFHMISNKDYQRIKSLLLDVEEELEWARMTIKDKLKFGLPEEQAIRMREKRCNGVLITSTSNLRVALDILRGQK